MGNTNSQSESLSSKSLSSPNLATNQNFTFQSDLEAGEAHKIAHRFASFKQHTHNLFAHKKENRDYESVQNDSQCPNLSDTQSRSCDHHSHSNHHTPCLKSPDEEFAKGGIDEVAQQAYNLSKWNPMYGFHHIGHMIKANLSPTVYSQPLNHHDSPAAANLNSVVEEQSSVPNQNDDVAGILNSGLFLLRPSECKALRRTWGYIIKDPQNIGIAVFNLIFKRCPEIRMIFPSFVNKSQDELVKDHVFRSHSKRFIFTIRSMIDNLQDLKSVTTLMEALGRLHQKFPGFKPEYWIIFKNCILTVWEDIMGDDYTPEVRAAWELVINLMIIKMKEGYETTA